MRRDKTVMSSRVGILVAAHLILNPDKSMISNQVQSIFTDFMAEITKKADIKASSDIAILIGRMQKTSFTWLIFYFFSDKPHYLR